MILFIKWLLCDMMNYFKAWLATKKFHQHPNIAYVETFSLIIKPTTICVVLTIAISKQWVVHQLGINNAFLHGSLTKDVFMAQQPRFISESNQHVSNLIDLYMVLRRHPTLGLLSSSNLYSHWTWQTPNLIHHYSTTTKNL